MMLRFLIALLRRALGFLITAVVLILFGRGARARKTLRLIRMLRRVVRL